MNSILVVERSTTLSHLLGRTLAAANLHDRVELSSYDEALAQLRECERTGRRHRILLLGAPPRPTRDFAELCDYLKTPGAAQLPVVVLAHEKTADIGSWIDTRAESQFVPWSQFAKIPVAIRQLSPEPDVLAEDAASAKPPNGLRVLFVDDSASIRLAYQRMLERDGFATDTAGTIAEGFERARGGAYDLAIIDYFLPDGEGDELCRRLHKEPASAQMMLAIITGTYREDAIKRCLEAGAVECMFKNEAKELFLARVNSLARQILMQKKETAEKLRLDGILGSVGDGVYGVDARGVVNFVNPTAMRLLGVADESELVGRGALEAFHHGGDAAASNDTGVAALVRA